MRSNYRMVLKRNLLHLLFTWRSFYHYSLLTFCYAGHSVKPVDFALVHFYGIFGQGTKTAVSCALSHRTLAKKSFQTALRVVMVSDL